MQFNAFFAFLCHNNAFFAFVNMQVFFVGRSITSQCRILHCQSMRKNLYLHKMNRKQSLDSPLLSKKQTNRVEKYREKAIGHTHFLYLSLLLSMTHCAQWCTKVCAFALRGSIFQHPETENKTRTDPNTIRKELLLPLLLYRVAINIYNLRLEVKIRKRCNKNLRSYSNIS